MEGSANDSIAFVSFGPWIGLLLSGFRLFDPNDEVLCTSYELANRMDIRAEDVGVIILSYGPY
jgi:hypothetical protein